ncbi:glycosyltransferase [Sulfurimonas paralvinellae]|uniref:Glycosyltransferase family 4 protein n=1 Tax=Sulfurimonas paralvinellae TaxID=317658 RepID=A0A7M1B8P9_9BACT|nr:glycosyltransferase [Sulfurimonas paralvinellae]QOP46113.1 glycosyltransferase family 4 protein [Sulfurimonas paralvinellae]
MKKKSPTALICLSHHIGGMELAATKLANNLSKETDITYIIKKDTFIHTQCKENPDYTNLKYEAINFSTTLLSPSIVFGVRKIIKDKGIKNVIFVGASEMKSLYFAFLGLDINLIVRHGTIKSHPKKDWFHRLVYSNVSTHVAISKYMLGNIQKIIPFGKNTKTTVIVPSLAKKISTMESTTSNVLRLLHAGRVTSGKGIDNAILACQTLHDHKIDFSFDNFGPSDSKYGNKLNQLLCSITYADKIHINGFTDKIYDEYPKHDIFIFPTPDEGYGNVMMEAISHGIIVLAFDNTAISNFGEMGFHIHLVEDKSLDALKERLLFIAQNLVSEKKKAQANKEIAKKVFAPERETNEYLALLY